MPGVGSDVESGKQIGAVDAQAGDRQVGGIGASRHEADVDAGLNVVYEDGSLLFIGYQGTIRNEMSDHGIHAGIRIQF